MTDEPMAWLYTHEVLGARFRQHPWPNRSEGWTETPLYGPEALAARDARIEQLEAEVKTALDREAETTARYDAKIDALEAEIARKDEALRECRRAVSGGREEPRRRVRDIVDLTLRKPAALETPHEPA